MHHVESTLGDAWQQPVERLIQVICQFMEPVPFVPGIFGIVVGLNHRFDFAPPIAISRSKQGHVMAACA